MYGFQKPFRWAVIPGATHPNWLWFWRGLVVCCPMWEGNANTIYDVGPRKLSANLLNTSVTWEAMGRGFGINNANTSANQYAFRFDAGTYEKHRDAVSVMLIIKPDAVAATSLRIFGVTDGAADNYSYLMAVSSSSSTQLRWRLPAPSTGATEISGGILSANTRTVLVGTYNGVSMAFYQDGNTIGTSARTGQLRDQLTGLCALGNDTSGGNPNFDGSIEFLVVWNRGLTDAEALAISRQPYAPLWPYWIIEATEGVLYTLDASGAVAATGSLIKIPQIVLVGAITPTSNVIKDVKLVYSGAVTSQGALNHSIVSLLSGVVTSAGNLIHYVIITLTGSITSGGTLATVKLIILNVAGFVTSAGNLIHYVIITLTGSIISGGTLDVIKTTLLSLTGAISSSGNLIKSAGLGLSGSVLSNGLVIYRILKTMAGSVTPSGLLDVIRVTFLIISGNIIPIGNLVKSVYNYISGSVTGAGTIIKLAYLLLSGTITSSGVLSTFTGVVTSIAVYFKGMFKGLFRGMK